MFIANCFRSAAAQHDLLQESYELPADTGLKLTLSHFDGYSPILEGSIRTSVTESHGSEKEGDIIVKINVKSSSPTYKENIRVNQENNSIYIATGGLSMLSQLTAPRLSIEVLISLPRSIDNLSITSPSLPITISTGKTNDVLLETSSSSISVSKIEARSLTVGTNSGHITFEDYSTQVVDKFTRVSNGSGGSSIGSSISCPDVAVTSYSGSIRLGMKTTAEEFEVMNYSGSISGVVEYVKGITSVSSFENPSGSTGVEMKGWSGFLTARSWSGSKKVSGRGLERWNEGWKKGDGKSTADFVSKSGSIRVEVV